MTQPTPREMAQVFVDAWGPVLLFTHEGVRVSLQGPPTINDRGCLVVKVESAVSSGGRPLVLDRDRRYEFFAMPPIVPDENGSPRHDPVAALKWHLVHGIGTTEA